MPCQTITVESEPDESQLAVDTVQLSSPNPGVVVATYEVTNNVVSGSGSTVSGTVGVTVDGSQVATEAVFAAPGETRSASVEIENLQGGSTPQICVELVG